MTGSAVKRWTLHPMVVRLCKSFFLCFFLSLSIIRVDRRPADDGKRWDTLDVASRLFLLFL